MLQPAVVRTATPKLNVRLTINSGVTGWMEATEGIGKSYGKS